MAAIGEFFKSIGTFFSNVITLVRSFFEDIIYVIKLIGAAIGKIPSYLGFLPSAVIAVFVAGLTLIVIYKVLGRD